MAVHRSSLATGQKEARHPGGAAPSSSADAGYLRMVILAMSEKPPTEVRIR